MKIWVVGKEGLLGREMMHLLEERQIAHVGSSHKEADITDSLPLEKFYTLHRPTHIINSAAYVDVDQAEGVGKERAHLVNVAGVEHLAHLAKKYKLHLVHISTDYVFDGEKEGDYTEEDKTHPVNVYGETKREGERRLLEIYPKALSLRVASLYGVYKGGLITGIVKALQEKEEVIHVSDQISTPTYTKDISFAILDLLEREGIFHYAHHGSISRLELVNEVKMLMEEKRMEVKANSIKGITRAETNRPAMRPKKVVLATDKVEPYLSHPIRPLKEALRDYFKAVYGA